MEGHGRCRISGSSPLAGSGQVEIPLLTLPLHSLGSAELKGASGVGRTHDSGKDVNEPIRELRPPLVSHPKVV